MTLFYHIPLSRGKMLQSTFAATLWVRPPFPATTCRHRRKGKVPLHEKKGDRHQTGSDMSLTTGRVPSVPKIFCWDCLTCHLPSLAYCFRKNGGKCPSIHQPTSEELTSAACDEHIEITGWIIFRVRLQVK